MLDEHIETMPGVAGCRITVQNVAIWHGRMGKGADEIAAQYDLTLADMYPALAYYFDHREESLQHVRYPAMQPMEGCSMRFSCG